MAARFLKFCLQYSLRVAETIVVLDRFMKERIVDKGIPDEQVAVVPPWPLSAVRYDEPGRQAFRDRHNLSRKFVVMYAGNHSPCHPLGTLLEAAQKMAPREDVVFCFVGGGSEHRKIRSFAAEQHLD